jgi:hypothetical protein
MNMKKITILFLAGILSIALSAATMAEDESQSGQEAVEPLFQVARLVIAGSVDNREPVGVVDAFAASTEKVYCFLEATQIREDTTARVAWYHGERTMAVVDLSLRKGKRWRTYSSKKLGGNTGDWRVEIQDVEGNVLQVIGFTVE